MKKIIRKCKIGELIYEYIYCSKLENGYNDWPFGKNLKYLGCGEIYEIDGINFKENSYKKVPQLFHFWVEKKDDNE